MQFSNFTPGLALDGLQCGMMVKSPRQYETNSG